jgi:hypothetical protein
VRCASAKLLESPVLTKFVGLEGAAGELAENPVFRSVLCSGALEIPRARLYSTWRKVLNFEGAKWKT